MKILAISAALAVWGIMPAQIKQEREVRGFHSIDVSSAISVVLTMSDKESLVFEANEEVLEKLQAEVVDGELKLYIKGKTETSGKMIAYVHAKEIRSLDVSGAADLKLTNALKTEKLDLETEGAGGVKLDLQVKQLEADITGAADVEITGTADELELELSGASDFKGNKLVAVDARLKATGASKARVNVSGNLKINASGASNVIYNGVPKNKDITTSGAARVKAG